MQQLQMSPSVSVRSWGAGDPPPKLGSGSAPHPYNQGGAETAVLPSWRPRAGAGPGPSCGGRAVGCAHLHVSAGQEHGPEPVSSRPACGRCLVGVT